MTEAPPGFRLLRGHLDEAAQLALLDDIRAVVAAAPLFVPVMPRTGREMSVRMTNCGPLGWVTDRERGYRYQEAHPVTGRPWPPIPSRLMEIWHEVADWPAEPEACLVNHYTEGARMGLHQDRDEQDLKAPVVSVSLGDSCRFRLGGTGRGGKTTSFRLESGDVVVLGGEARMAFHGVDRVFSSSSGLLAGGGRINLTLRCVSPTPS